MGIDSGNNAEKAIAMELKHLNKKLDRLIDILLKSIPNHLVVKGMPKVDEQKVNEEGTAMVPIWQHGKTVMVPMDQVKIEES